MTERNVISELRESLRAFNREREWEQFHSPKNLACGLVVEAAELLEVFTWQSSAEIGDDDRLRLEEEIGDVQLFLLNLADKLGLDPVECAAKKLEINRTKYPIESSRGSSKKYTKLGTASEDTESNGR